jgi:aryl-alcohol dehydrogenase-like predicted oxidoreductase
MDKRNIGSLEVTVVGLGCNNFGPRLDAAATAKVVHAALDAGVNFFDTAELYGDGKSEEYLGRALDGRRNEAVIASKFGHTAYGGKASPAYIREAIERSLKRLRVDCIDLYQLHTPDPEVPIADTLGALNEIVKAGKAREIGCSNFSVTQLREAAVAAPPGHARFVSVQNQYSLFHREPERDVLPECERTGMAFLPYFPLAYGLLTGKYRKGQPIPQGTRIANNDRYRQIVTEESLDAIERLVAFAEQRGHTLLDLAFAWLLAHKPIASVIAGAMTDAQIRANASAGGWRLSSSDLLELDAIVPELQAVGGGR